MDVPPGRAHPRTVDALVRRGLAEISIDVDESYAVITDAGVELLARNPTGVPTRPGARR